MQLEHIDTAIAKNFQPLWVTKAYLLSLDENASSELISAAYQTTMGMKVDLRLKRYFEWVHQKL